MKQAGADRNDAPALGQRPVEGGKAHVVADRQAEQAPRRLREHGPLAARIGGRFAPALAAGQVDVEEVDLVVGGDDVAVGIDDEGAVGDLVAGAHGDRADMHDDAPLAGDLAQGGEGRVALLGADLVEQGGAGALDERGHLRRLHVVGALPGGLAHEGDCCVAVGERIAPGAHLDAGGDEAIT